MRYFKAISPFILFVALTAGVWFSAYDIASAQEWKADYERLCGASLEDSEKSIDKLKSELQEIEALGKAVETMDFPQKKTYVFRIGKCRDLVKYYIEIQESR